MCKIKSVFFKAECGNCCLDIICILQKLVDKMRLIGVFVHDAALDASHGSLLQRAGVFGTIYRQLIEPLFFLFGHYLLFHLFLPILKQHTLS